MVKPMLRLPSFLFLMYLYTARHNIGIIFYIQKGNYSNITHCVTILLQLISNILSPVNKAHKKHYTCLA
jgi:hypothetical protein